jgi:hypothetical protein
VKVCTLDGQYVRLRRLPAADVMALLDEMTDPDTVLLGLDLDDGRSIVHVPRAAVARIEIDWELGWWSRFTSWLLAKIDHWL